MRKEMADGVRDILPAMIAGAPIALLYGALAVGKGMTPVEASLSSFLIFAGGAQFAALELWRSPPPILALVFSTLLINARHILMGASLRSKLGKFSPLQRAFGLFFMADENWAMSERRAAARVLTPVYYLAMSVVFWANWSLWTTLGAIGGAFLGDPKRIGADFAFTALFIGLVAGFWRGRSTAVTVAASAIASAAAYRVLGPPWHVAAGALCGVGAAYLYARRAKA
ncbi:MAG TPA: AzlC family ABC transporter permease [Roseiarcus sp.]|nr:AzlC family ABC transporter permease [Roseiarcus sp.]